MQSGDSPLSRPAATSLRAALLWGSGIGAATFRDLRSHFGDDEVIAGATFEQLRGVVRRLTDDQARALTSASREVHARGREVLAMARAGVDVVRDGDSSYPPRLLRLAAPPPLVCIRGRVPATEPAIAIVGTRSPSTEDAEMARALGLRCAQLNIPVISGLAVGIDTAAHLGALEGGGKTVAVLGSGIARVYPRRNGALADHIARRGALLSECPPNSRVSVASLMARNRITAALASTVIVVASGTTGGSLATARHAERMGLRVAAVVSDRPHSKREGNQMLLQAGAAPIHGPEDLEALLDGGI